MIAQFIKIMNKLRICRITDRGFTFIELILYVSILTIMLSVIIPFAWDVIGGSIKSSAQQEVNTQARYLSERIKYEIRNALNVNVLGNSLIILSTSNPATNPTYIFRTGNNLLIMQGNGSSQIMLHSANTKLSYWNVNNYSSADGKTKNVQFTFTLETAFNSSNQKYIASTTVEADAEVRSR